MSTANAKQRTSSTNSFNEFLANYKKNSWWGENSRANLATDVVGAAVSAKYSVLSKLAGETAIKTGAIE